MSASPAPFKTLEGKVALVTGSGRGIGRGIALELAARGASVVINYANSAGPANKVVKEIEELGSKGFAIKADVTKVPEVRRLFQEAKAHFGKLDIVMSNSGTEIFKEEEDSTILCCSTGPHSPRELRKNCFDVIYSCQYVRRTKPCFVRW
ncbi:hypothetical protein EYC84_003808 [Monilinia fructicola]|uniref:Uncharacterized protein n=1 Tax=Monilinia fructicola TaxID=38448 RepID=A0A5M9JVV3_MONFR|nr:hypothetical protein EYC84_003808 [Monilinia fructicola]